MNDLQRDNAELRAKLEAAEAERDRLVKLLHDLTIGGSEFVGNPDRCVKWIQESLSNGIRQTVKASIGWQKAKSERDALQERVKELEQAVEAAQAYYQSWIDHGGDLSLQDALWVALDALDKKEQQR